jgi:hypothetical protein
MMSRLLLAVALGFPLLLGPCSLSPQQAAAPLPARAVSAPPRVDFDSRIRPILEAHCMPCHFPGGKMYDRLPFDRAQTIRILGEKMFTRIKDEHEQEVLRSFLAQAP